MTLKEAILSDTDGGYTIFEHYLGSEIDFSKPFSIREERTPSTSLKCLDGVYYIKDFGDTEYDTHAKNAIDFIMYRFDMSFSITLNRIIKDLNLPINPSQYKSRGEEVNINIELQELSNKQIQYFKDRGISKATLDLNNISATKHYFPQANKELSAIVFPYYYQNKLVNAKYRAFYKKNGKTERAFTTHKGGLMSWYGIDRLTPSTKECIIVEGEVDKLSIDEIYTSTDTEPPLVLSVPNGVNSLNAINNASEQLSQIETFYIFVDNDQAGEGLKNNLLRMFGKQKCKIVPNQGGKDANEILVKQGIEGLISCLDNAEYLPVEGELNVSAYTSNLYSIFLNGITSGDKVGYFDFDKNISFKTPELTTITGIPGHGKSTFLNQIVVRLSKLHNWKTCFYSPEFGTVERHMRELIEQYKGKAFYRPNKKTPSEKLMSDDEFWDSHDWLSNNMFFINPIEPTEENLYAAFEAQIRKHNIKAIVIDPFNRIIFKGQKDLNTINNFLTKLNQFKKKNDVHVFLVAHPRKMGKKTNGLYEVPNLYDIAHSSDFFNQVDNGITIYRDMESNLVEAHVQKVKDKDNGRTGFSLFSFDVFTNQYSQNDSMI